MTTNTLTGRRVAILAADGFEKAELVLPMKALQKAGAEVEVISLRPGRIRGMNLHEPAGKIKVDKTISAVRPEDYHGLFIPGGFINPDILRQSAEVREFVRSFEEQKKPIASICHGPWVLASSHLMNGRTLTSWPGIRDDMVHAGATWVDEEIVVDGNWLTSRGPQDLPVFCKGLTEFFASDATLLSPQGLGLASSPQKQEPPSLVMKTMKSLPRPSIRSLATVSLLVLSSIKARRKLLG